MLAFSIDYYGIFFRATQSVELFCTYVAQVYKADIVSSFLAVPELIKEGAIESGAYYKDLLMLYVFTAIGAVPVIKNQIKGK